MYRYVCYDVLVYISQNCSGSLTLSRCLRLLLVVRASLRRYVVASRSATADDDGGQTPETPLSRLCQQLPALTGVLCELAVCLASAVEAVNSGVLSTITPKSVTPESSGNDVVDSVAMETSSDACVSDASNDKPAERLQLQQQSLDVATLRRVVCSACSDVTELLPRLQGLVIKAVATRLLTEGRHTCTTARAHVDRIANKFMYMYSVHVFSYHYML